MVIQPEGLPFAIDPLGKSYINSAGMQTFGKINIESMYAPAAEMQQTIVIIFPFSAQVIAFTVFFHFDAIILRVF